MRGVKTIDLGFSVPFKDGGSYSETTKITVREPGLGKHHVYATMKAFVAKASPVIEKVAMEMQAARVAAGLVAPKSDDDDVPPPADDDAEDEGPSFDVLDVMSMGLGVDNFPRFIDYVKTELTNAPKLATVGEAGKAPITDETWMKIEEQGGMQAVYEVLSEFTSFFFMGRRRSRKPNGAGSSPSLPSPSPATSPTKTAKTSRSVN